MDRPRDHTKQSKSERERQIPYDITYTWNLKYDTKEHIYETKQTHRHKEPTCGCQVGMVGEGWNVSLGLKTSSYK